MPETGSGTIVVLGGANVDIRAKSLGAAIAGTSNPGRIALSPGGVARNIAEHLAHLGCPVSLISAVGRDAQGDALIRDTAAAEVDVAMVARHANATGTYCAIFGEDGELMIAVSDMRGIDGLDPEMLAAHERALDAAALILADCNLPQPCLAWLLRYRDKLAIEPVSVAKSGRLKAILDPAMPVFAATPNRDESRALTGLDDPVEALRALRAMGVRNVMINLGAQGAIVGDEDGQVAELASLSGRDAISGDVTGAGDASVAGLLFALARGLPFVTAARHAQAAAALHVMSVPVASGTLRSLTEKVMEGRP